MSSSIEQGTTYFENPTFFDMEQWRIEAVDTANIILDKLGGDRADEDGDRFREYFWSSDDLKSRFELRRYGEEDAQNYQLVVYNWTDDDGEGKTNYYFSDEQNSELYVDGEDRQTANTLANQFESLKFLHFKLGAYLDGAAGYDGKEVKNWPQSRADRVFFDMMACMLSEDELIVQEVTSRRRPSIRRLGFHDTVSEVKQKHHIPRRDAQGNELVNRAIDLAEQRAAV